MLGEESKSNSAPEPSTLPTPEDTWRGKRDRMRLYVLCVVNVKGRRREGLRYATCCVGDTVLEM